MEEIWKDVVGYEGLYRVSCLGNVFSEKTGKTLKPHASSVDGYMRLILRRNGKSECKTIHRLVATAFIENVTGLKEINHIDENKLNNNAQNLEWCTHKYNNTYGTKIQRTIKNTNYQVISDKNSLTLRQYDQSGRLVRLWKSATECKKILGYDNSVIAKCCRGKAKLAYGFRWEYCG